MELLHATLLVDDYDRGIRFFVEALGFDLAEDTPMGTADDGEPKRWVVVRPPGATSGLLLARAANPDQRAALGGQAGGRVAFFLRVDDFEEMLVRLRHHGVELAGDVRDEPYGRVVVFVDVSGNRWDLLGPPA